MKASTVSHYKKTSANFKLNMDCHQNKIHQPNANVNKCQITTKNAFEFRYCRYYNMCITFLDIRGEVEPPAPSMVRYNKLFHFI